LIGKYEKEYRRILLKGEQHHNLEELVHPLPQLSKGRPKQRPGKNLLDRLSDFEEETLHARLRNSLHQQPGRAGHPLGQAQTENLRLLPEPLGSEGILPDPRIPFHGTQTGAGERWRLSSNEIRYG
jgi:hypothetical protein